MSELTRREVMQRGAIVAGGLVLGGTALSGTAVAEGDVSAITGSSCGEIDVQNDASSPVTIFVEGEETVRLDEGEAAVITQSDDEPVRLRAAKSRGNSRGNAWPTYRAVSSNRERRCREDPDACDSSATISIFLPPGQVVTVNGESEATVVPGDCESGSDGGDGGDDETQEYYIYEEAVVFLENDEQISTTLYSTDPNIYGCDVEYDITKYTDGDPCSGVASIAASEEFGDDTFTGYIPSLSATPVEISPPCLTLDLGETPPSGPLPCS